MGDPDDGSKRPCRLGSQKMGKSKPCRCEEKKKERKDRQSRVGRGRGLNISGHDAASQYAAESPIDCNITMSCVGRDGPDRDDVVS